MSADPQTDDWLAFFDRLSLLYRTLVLGPLWGDRFADHREDPWSALGLFLYAYAFGRPGGSARDAGAGAEALSRAREHGPFTGAVDAAETTWTLACGLRGGTTTGPRSHPLYPSSDPEDVGVRPRPSLVEMRFVGDVAGFQSSLTAFASSLLARDDLSTVLGILTGIRGIGAARAGWFLRDLAVWEEPGGPDGEYAPEPVDGHVRRAVTMMAAGSPGGDGVDVGAWLRERCEPREDRAHRVSAGMSYFGERIAGDPFTLEGCLCDLALAKQLAERHRERLSRASGEG